jgi:hypothetical protein
MPNLGGFEWLLLPVLLIALVVWLIVRSVRKRGSVARTQASLDPNAIGAQLFTGAPTATYQLAPDALPFEVVVAQALQRGYRLEAQSPTGALVFSRQS